MKKYIKISLGLLISASMSQAMEGQQENQSYPAIPFLPTLSHPPQTVVLEGEEDKSYLMQELENLKPEEVKGFLSGAWLDHTWDEDSFFILDKISNNQAFYPSDRIKAYFLIAERKYSNTIQSITDEEAYGLFKKVLESRDATVALRAVSALYIGKMVYHDRAKAITISQTMEILRNFISVGYVRSTITGQMSFVLEGLEKKLMNSDSY